MKRGVLASVMALGVSMAAATAGAQTPTNVRFSLDWAFQGPQAPFLLAVERGYFQAEGINITMDRGFGSGDVPLKIRAGTYDIGFADINPTIRLKAQEPAVDLVAVAILYDASPLAVMTLRRQNITRPQDLVGKTLAAPEVDAGRQLFPAFARATGLALDSVRWMNVTPQLRETMLAQGQANAITGFTTSGILSLRAAGVADADIVTLRYQDFGVALLSSSIITTRAWANANPRATTGVLRAVFKAHLDAIANPDAAIQALVRRDPLVDPRIERDRMMMSLNELMLTPHVRATGISEVDPARLQAAIDTVRTSFGIERAVPAAEIYTPQFLPPLAERAIPRS
ncbi:MAG: taurine ABC transporter permease [Alphaproteobacteria bacterium]|nr:ABC transporter substrate-binding protein [Alphaproteobacteria bacterium]TAD88296.1 MAG: taurine ABC transporter permease [Alphaproteobacteria bacterium]